MKDRIIVTVPKNFGERNLEKLKSRLETLTGESAQRMQFVWDDALLGGFVVRWKNRVYDSSLKARLEQVRQKLATGE